MCEKYSATFTDGLFLGIVAASVAWILLSSLYLVPKEKAKIHGEIVRRGLGKYEVSEHGKIEFVWK